MWARGGQGGLARQAWQGETWQGRRGSRGKVGKDGKNGLDGTAAMVHGHRLDIHGCGSRETNDALTCRASRARLLEEVKHGDL
jgi:hypothetical protein